MTQDLTESLMAKLNDLGVKIDKVIAERDAALDALGELRKRCGTVSPLSGPSSVAAVRDAGKFLAAMDQADAVLKKAGRR